MFNMTVAAMFSLSLEREVSIHPSIKKIDVLDDVDSMRRDP